MAESNSSPHITDLVSAIGAQDMQALQILLQNGADPNAPNKEGITPLTAAALMLDVQALELLLRTGAEPNAPNRGGLTPLAAVVQRNDFEAVSLLLQVGADPNIPHSDGTTLLSYAMEKGFWYVADYLFKAGATPPPYKGDPNGQYKYTGTTILPSDVLEDMKRETVLTYLIKNAGYKSIFEILSNGADVNKLNANKQSPLRIAVQERPWPYVAVQLVKRGAWIDPANPDPDEVIDTKTGATRLLSVIMEGVDAAAVRDILEGGADPNKADNTGLTPLALARAYKWDGVEKMLLAKGADPSVTFPDPNQMIGKDKNIPMILYAARGQHCHDDYVPILLSAGANPDAADAEGTTAASMAGVHNNVWLLEQLKAAGADLFKPNNRGLTAFDNACYNGHAASIKYLLAQAPQGILNELHGVESKTTPFILVASRKGHAQLLEALIAYHGAEINVQDSHGYTPLEKAVETQDIEMVRVLLKHGAKVEAPLPEGKEFHHPLHHAVTYHYSDNSNLEIAQLLLDAGANPDIVDQYGNSPAYCNITNARGSAVSLLKAAGADFFKDNNNGESAFDKACEYGYRFASVKAILEGEPEDILSIHGRGKALCKASTVETLDLLIKYGADVNARDKYGSTALEHAVKNDKPEMVRALLKHGAKIEMPVQEGEKAHAPLLVTLADRDAPHAAEITKMLLDAGANPCAVNERGNPVANVAAGKGNLEILRHLKAAGADLYKVNPAGETPLDWACGANHIDAVKYLVTEAPEDIIGTGQDDLALIHAAQDDIYNDHKGRVELMQFLIANGANVNAYDKHGKTSLEYAFVCDDPDMMRVLIKHGAKPETYPSEEGSIRNPLLFRLDDIYSSKNASETVKMLVEAGADPNAVAVSEKNDPPVGSSLLFSSLDHPKHAKALLDNGADPHSTSATGKSVAHQCIDSRDVKTLKVLLEKGLDPTRTFSYTSEDGAVKHETSAYEHIQDFAANNTGDDVDEMLAILKKVAEKIMTEIAEKERKLREEQSRVCAEKQKILRGKAPKIQLKP